MREKWLTKVKIKAIDPQNFFAPQKNLRVPRAYESLNPGLIILTSKFATID
jgi:hypothetical protein